MKKTLGLFYLLSGISLRIYSQVYPPNDPHWGAKIAGVFTPGTPVWVDDFTVHDLTWLQYYSYWVEEDYSDHNGEPELYLKANLSMDNTNGLRLKEIGVPGGIVSNPPPNQNPDGSTWSPHYYTSGAIDSWGAHTIQYGYVEAEIQAPDNYGAFPAFWLWSCTPQGADQIYNEIDIFEDIPGTVQDDPNNPLYGTIRDKHSLTSNIHYNTYTRTDCKADYNSAQINPIPAAMGDYTGFHKYGLEWTPSKIIWYIDGKVYRNSINPGFSDNSPVTPGAINQAMSILLDYALHAGVRMNNCMLQNNTPPYCPYDLTHEQNPTCAYSYNNGPPVSGGNTAYFDVPSWYSSINPISVNSTSGTYMNIKNVKYYQMAPIPDNGCSSSTFIINSSFNWSNPSASGYNYQNINKNVTTSGSVSMPNNATNYIRASNSIELGGGGSSFTMGTGTTLYLDVNPCHN